MVRRIITIILLMAVGSMAFADVQPGYVRTIKRPGMEVEYLDNVQISVKGISGSFRSKGRGRFELELQPLGLKVGSPFTISGVFKSGYELYDDNLSMVYSPGVPLEIVLRNIAQEAADRQKFADNMYKGAIASRDKKIKDLDRQLNEGNITLEKYREELQRCNDVFDRYQADINTIAKRYAGLDYENIDPVTEAINVAFSNGDFVLADSLLTSLGGIDAEIDSNISARSAISAKIDLGKAIISEGNSELKQNLKDAERLAELAYAKYLSSYNNLRNDSAAYYLRKRADLVPDNIHYQLEAGVFIKEVSADYPLAFEYYDRALTLAMERYGENHPDVASSYSNIALISTAQGEYAKALEYLEKALKIWLDVYGENHPDTAKGYNNLGMVYSYLGDYTKALENYGKAQKIQLEILGEDHPDLAAGYTGIGVIYTNQGHYDKALENYFKAMKIWGDAYGENYVHVATVFDHIGWIYIRQGEYAMALESFFQAMKIQLDMLGENHPALAESYNGAATVYANVGEYDMALENFGKALKIHLDVFGENHPDVALGYNNIGVVYADQGKYEQALENYEKALKIRLEAFGENHPDVALNYNNIGGVFYTRGMYREALENFEKALKIETGIFGENHPKVEIMRRNVDYVKILLEQQNQ